VITFKFRETPEKKMGNPEPNPFFWQTNKDSERKRDRCRDSMEAILTNGVDCVGRKNRNSFVETFEKMKDNSIYIRIGND